jgi:hypothetical protein
MHYDKISGKQRLTDDLIPLVELLSRVAYRRLRNPSSRVKLGKNEGNRESSTVRAVFDRQAKR